MNTEIITPPLTAVLILDAEFGDVIVRLSGPGLEEPVELEFGPETANKVEDLKAIFLHKLGA